MNYVNDMKCVKDMSYVNNMSYADDICYINKMNYVKNIIYEMSYVNYMSILMNHLKSNDFFFPINRDEFEITKI